MFNIQPQWQSWQQHSCQSLLSLINNRRFMMTSLAGVAILLQVVQAILVGLLFQVGFVLCITAFPICSFWILLSHILDHSYFCALWPMEYMFCLSPLFMFKEELLPSLSLPFHLVAFIPYFQSLISQLTDDLPSSITPSSSPNASNSLLATFPSLPNVRIPTRSLRFYFSILSTLLNHFSLIK